MQSLWLFLSDVGTTIISHFTFISSISSKSIDLSRKMCDKFTILITVHVTDNVKCCFVSKCRGDARGLGLQGEGHRSGKRETACPGTMTGTHQQVGLGFRLLVSKSDSGSEIPGHLQYPVEHQLCRYSDNKGLITKQLKIIIRPNMKEDTPTPGLLSESMRSKAGRHVFAVILQTHSRAPYNYIQKNAKKQYFLKGCAAGHR